MSQLVLKCQANNGIQFSAALKTDGTYPTRIPTIVEPTGDGVIAIANSSVNEAPIDALLRFHGTGNNNDQFNCRIIGWTLCKGDGNKAVADLWLPIDLVEFQLTLSNIVGVVNSIIPATTRFADTITIVKEPTSAADVTPLGTTIIFSPADDAQLAWAKVRLHGVQKIEYITDLGAGSGSDAVISLG